MEIFIITHVPKKIENELAIPRLNCGLSSGTKSSALFDKETAFALTCFVCLRSKLSLADNYNHAQSDRE